MISFLTLLLHFLHVESFKLRRETVQKHGRADDVRHPPFGSLRDVAADRVIYHLGLPVLVFDRVTLGVLRGVLDAVVVEPLDRVCVGEPEEGPLKGLEGWVESFDGGSRGRILQKQVDRFADLITTKM